jgi:putative component of toxin-antitoxin plasmid stabilization module
MYTIKQLPQFSDWLSGLKDGLTRRLATRLRKAALVNLGDVKPVGEVCSKCVSISVRVGVCITCSAARC